MCSCESLLRCSRRATSQTHFGVIFVMVKGTFHPLQKQRAAAAPRQQRKTSVQQAPPSAAEAKKLPLPAAARRYLIFAFREADQLMAAACPLHALQQQNQQQQSHSSTYAAGCSRCCVICRETPKMRGSFASLSVAIGTSDKHLTKTAAAAAAAAADTAQGAPSNSFFFEANLCLCFVSF